MSRWTIYRRRDRGEVGADPRKALSDVEFDKLEPGSVEWAARKLWRTVKGAVQKKTVPAAPRPQTQTLAESPAPAAPSWISRTLASRPPPSPGLGGGHHDRSVPPDPRDRYDFQNWLRRNRYTQQPDGGWESPHGGLDDDIVALVASDHPDWSHAPDDDWSI